MVKATDRQRQAFLLRCEGLTYKEVAHRMGYRSLTPTPWRGSLQAGTGDIHPTIPIASSPNATSRPRPRPGISHVRRCFAPSAGFLLRSASAIASYCSRFTKGSSAPIRMRIFALTVPGAGAGY
jgi:hypothetical protein